MTLTSESLLRDLTDAQREAVVHVDGPLLIVAGAGSGKTRVITRRVAHLVSLGIPASSILAITFTNKAAGEMKTRVSAVLDRPVRDFGRLDQPWPTICTFHSLCLRILRHYAPHVGLPHNFSIFDSSDQTKLVKEALKALDLSSTNFPPGTVHGAIGDAKNKLLSPEQYAANVRDFYGRTVARVYVKYQDLLRQNNALDFDDLLLRTAQAFRDHKDVLEELQQRWQYVLIDEYQDTNHAQYVIAHALAMKHRNICVVGDPDQCLPPGTLVSTPGGPRAIETLREGDLVLSATGRGRIGESVVDRVMVKPFSGRLARVRTADGLELRATPNHHAFAEFSKADGAPSPGGATECSPRRQPVVSTQVRGSPLSPLPVLRERVRVRALPETGSYLQFETEPSPPPSPGVPGEGVMPRQGRVPAGSASRLCRSHWRQPWENPRRAPRAPEGRKSIAAVNSYAPAGLALAPARNPTACAVGYILSPLRGWEGSVPGLSARAHLTARRTFLLMPFEHVAPGMVLPVERDGGVVESAVTSVDWEDYHGPVYDLSVPDTRNYIANGVVVHNSIYAWRGADIKNILEFERDYPDAKVVRLEQNYRSTKTILAIASKLIANNLQRKDKGLWTENGQGEPAELYLCQDEHDEAQVVMRRLKEINEKQGIAWSQMAIFYRMNSLSRVMEEALFKAKVPYQIARGVEFYNRKEIKDVLAYLRVVANPADEVSLGRIVNVPPRGLGDGAMEKIQAFAVGNGMSTFQAMGEAGKVAGLTTRAVNSAKTFVGLVRKWREIARLGQEGETRGQGDTETRREGGGELQFEPTQAKGEVQTLMESVVRTSGYDDLLKKLDKEKEEGERPSDNVGELINAAAEFDREQPEGTLHDYLAQVSLVSDADHLKGAGGAVTLMTLHAAKGLEFPVVAMIGLEDGILPHSRARDNISQLEEERRLCFVGITRAQQYLIISKAQTRAFRGSRERTITSPFLNELPPEFLRVTDRTGIEGIDGGDDDDGWGRSEGYPKKEDEAAQFRRGQMVRHPTFGIGRIADVSAAGQHTRAVVEFNTVGRKTLILQYARLEPVG